jgi:c-di-AMP phosphodiesterase-like protein
VPAQVKRIQYFIVSLPVLGFLVGFFYRQYEHDQVALQLNEEILLELEREKRKILRAQQKEQQLQSSQN